MKHMQPMTWNWKSSSLWQRLLVALLIVAFVSAFRAIFFGNLGRGIPYLLYYPAVTLAALYGGLPAGLLATTLSTALSFFWVQRGYTSPPESLALVIFILSCVMVSFVGDAIRHAHKQAKLAQEKTEAANQELQREVAERKQAEEEIRQRNRELAAISQAVTAIATSLDFQTVLDRALRGALELTNMEGGTVCLVDHATQALKLVAEINTSAEVRQDLATNLVKIGDCLCGTCAKTCQPLILWDNASGSQFATREATRNEGIRFHAAFPLCVKDGCIGVLCIFAKSAAKPTEHALALVGNLCGPVALAIENARLFEAARQELAEREQAEAALRESEERYRTLFDNATDGIMLLSPEGQILAVSESFARMHGYSKKELRRMSIKDLDTPESFQQFPERQRRQLAGESFSFEVEHRHKDGHVLQYEVSASLISLGGEKIIQSFHHDITERKRAEESLRSTDRALKTISACNQALVRATDEKEMLQQVCQAIVEQGGYRMAWLGFANDDEKKSIHIAGSAGFEAGYLEEAHINWSEDDERGRGPSGTAFRTGRMVVCNDFQNDPRTAPWKEEAAKRGYAAIISLPLKNAGQSFGALTIYAARVNAFHDEEIKLLSELADDLAFGINAMRTRAERKLAGEIILQERNFSQASLDSLPGLFYLFDAQSHFLRFNKNFEKVSGYSTAELFQMTPLDFFDGMDRERIADAIQQAIQTGEVVVEADFLSKDRTRTQFLFTGRRFQLEQAVGGAIAPVAEDGGHRPSRRRRGPRLQQYPRGVALAGGFAQNDGAIA
jgi:PAS domain S-box-containing protein